MGSPPPLALLGAPPFERREIRENSNYAAGEGTERLAKLLQIKNVGLVDLGSGCAG
jgi:hypothetical protein